MLTTLLLTTLGASAAPDLEDLPVEVPGEEEGGPGARLRMAAERLGAQAVVWLAGSEKPERGS